MKSKSNRSYLIILLILLFIGVVTLLRIRSTKSQQKPQQKTAEQNITANNNAIKIAPNKPTTEPQIQVNKTNKTPAIKTHTLHNNNTYKHVATPKAPSHFPRLYLEGAAGSSVLGQIDLLIPIVLGQNYNFFAYGQSRYSTKEFSIDNNPWTISAGLGYRYIYKNMVLLGASILSDYSKTQSGHHISMLSPGVEVISKNWELHANGYLPFGNKTKWKQSGFASQFGNYSYIVAKGHIRYDAIFTYYEETGDGVDAELGRTLFSIDNTVVKGYVLGYGYLMPHNDNVVGGGARINILPKSYLKISLTDTYDKHNKNVFMAGMQVSLYDLFAHTKEIDAIDNKLFAPIDRNFGTIASGSNMRETGGPNDQYAKPKIDTPVIPPNPNPNPNPQPGPKPTPPTPPNPYVLDDNAWYFNGSSTTVNDKRRVGDPGTVENPYSEADFDQQTLAHIKQYSNEYGLNHADLFFSRGIYHHFGDAILLDGNYSLYGVNSDFVTPATGDKRPVFLGSINLENDSNNNIENIIMENDPDNYQDTAIDISNSKKIDIEDVTIGDQEDSDKNYATGINVSHGTDFTLNNSDITATTSGVNLNNIASSININNTNIHADGDKAQTGIDIEDSTAKTSISNSEVKAFTNGINAQNVNTLNVDHTVINSETGVTVNKSAGVTLDNSDITASTSGINLNGINDLINIDNTNIHAAGDKAQTAITITNSNTADASLQHLNIGWYDSYQYQKGIAIDGINNTDILGDITVDDSAINISNATTTKIQGQIETNNNGITLNNITKQIDIDNIFVAHPSSGSGTGIDIENSAAKTSISNSTVEAFTNGINLSGITAQVNIKDSTILDNKDNSQIGINAQNVNTLNVNHTVINSATGVTVDKSADVTLDNSDITASTSGINLNGINDLINIDNTNIHAAGDKAQTAITITNAHPANASLQNLNISSGEEKQYQTGIYITDMNRVDIAGDINANASAIDIDKVSNVKIQGQIETNNNGIILNNIAEQIDIDQLSVANRSSTSSGTGIDIENSAAKTSINNSEVDAFTNGMNLSDITAQVDIKDSSILGKTGQSQIGINAQNINTLNLDHTVIGSGDNTNGANGDNAFTTGLKLDTVGQANISNDSEIYGYNPDDTAYGIEINNTPTNISSGIIAAYGDDAYGIKDEGVENKADLLNITGGSIIGDGNRGVGIYAQYIDFNLIPTSSDISIKGVFHEKDSSTNRYAYGIQTDSTNLNIIGEETHAVEITASIPEETTDTVNAIGINAIDTNTVFAGEGNNISITATGNGDIEATGVKLGGKSTIACDNLNDFIHIYVLNNPNKIYSWGYGFDLHDNGGVPDPTYLSKYFDIKIEGFDSKEDYKS